MQQPDIVRDLIQLYHDCHWRSTQLQIIRDLAENPTQRALEFLFQLAMKDAQDIPIAEAAVRSLGQTQHPLAARFLVQFFHSCSDALRPTVIGALGAIPDRTLAVDFLKLLPVAIAEKKTLLVRNLVLTLGELKVKEALPYLIDVAKQKLQGSIATSALISIGKIARDPKILDTLEPLYRNDLLEHQLYTSVRSQIQFRSQWKLEDYLQKLFENATIHRALPYELNAFDPVDVKEGLKLFQSEANFERLCLALSRIDFPEVAQWYAEFFELEKLSGDQAAAVAKSISFHLNAEMARPLALLRKAAPESWLQAMGLCLPQADAEFKSFFASKDYLALEIDARVRAINELTQFGLSVQPNGARLESVGRVLESVLFLESESKVRTRILRACGQLKISTKKILDFAKDQLKVPELTRDCLFYMNACPRKNQVAAILELIEQKDLDPKIEWAAMRALSVQPELPGAEKPETHDKNLERVIATHLASKLEDARAETLEFLKDHPSPIHLPKVHACLRGKERKEGEERLQLLALVVLRNMHDESTADLIAPLLQSPSPSVSGRALDTLTVLPGLRAKRLVIDFLRDHSDDLEVCDKVIRCLRPPETPNPYFGTVVNEIILGRPDHLLLDGLYQLKAKLDSGVTSGGGAATGLKKGADVTALDLELSNKITGYEQLDESVRSALRSAELPFVYPHLFDEFIDKSSSILEYSKAIDLVLEREIGRKILLPRLESHLHEFQNTIHACALNEDYPSAERVIRILGLEKQFTVQSLPLHKMVSMAQGILSGRILNQHFKTLDGLRAWAIVMLVFSRKVVGKPLVPLKNLTDDQIAAIAKRLIALQEVRNPAAHRQTLVNLVDVDQVRIESHLLLNSLQKMFSA